MRKLVTKRIITNITPIPDADKIECVQIDGYEVEVETTNYNYGEDYGDYG